MLQFQTLGSPAVSGESGPCGGAAGQRKSLALLALLATSGARGISRDKIVARIWPEASAGKATHRLTQVLYSLRRDLGAGELFLGSTELRLNTAIITTDVAEFTAALEAGDFARAVAAYGGPFLDGFYLSDAPDFEHWVEEERSRLAQRHSAALEALARDAASHGDVVAAAGWWRQLSQVEPLNSRVVVCYMEALCTAGDRPSALRFAKTYETLLREEFDAEPDAVVREAAVRLKRQPSGSSIVGAAPAIAVLPFTNLTPDDESEYLGDGMTEELSAVLARVPGLRVASRTSVYALKAKGLDATQIGERLGVSALVEGSVRKEGNRIRLSVRLVKAADGCQLWSEIYERTIDDVLAMQEELSRGIAAALPLAASASAPVRQTTKVPDAYTLFLRGRYSAHKRTVAGLSLGTEYFEEAIERDPGYALAHAGLAECWALRGHAEFGDLRPFEAVPRARAAALEALRLDPRLAQAHSWLGVIHFLYDWDWGAAESEFRRAILLDPRYPYAEAWYAILLSALGRHEESFRRILHAEAIEPLSLQIRLCVGRCYFFARRYEQACTSLTDLLKAEPAHSLTTTWLARTLCAMNRHAEACEVLEQLSPAARQTPYLRAVTTYALAGAGRVDEARAFWVILEQEFEEGRVPLASAVGTSVLLQDRHHALDLLEKAVRRRDAFVPFLLMDPAYDRLREELRFKRVLAKLGLVPAAQVDAPLPH
ncbi:MAG: BTAD domain-containing putative transcriptional regulator [Gemmatimonadota bacterium]